MTTCILQRDAPAEDGSSEIVVFETDILPQLEEVIMVVDFVSGARRTTRWQVTEVLPVWRIVQGMDGHHRVASVTLVCAPFEP